MSAKKKRQKFTGKSPKTKEGEYRAKGEKQEGETTPKREYKAGIYKCRKVDTCEKGDTGEKDNTDEKGSEQ